MARAVELFKSRQVGSESAKLQYVIFEATSGENAYATLAATAPASYAGFSNRVVQQVERQGDDFWFGEVDYGKSERQETGDSTFEFDTGGGNQHITQSLAVLHTYSAPGFVAPNSYGAIGVTKDSVEGCDIVVPQYHFSVRTILDQYAVTASYRRNLYMLTGTINLGEWYGYDDGEVLFLGASGTYRASEENWEMVYKYAASPNQSGIVIGGISGVHKPGWSYLWVRYQDAKDTSSQSAVKMPIAVYVNQVYRQASWGGILFV